MTLTTQSPVAAPTSGLSIANIDVHVLAGGTIAAGDLLPVPASSILSAGPISGVTTASAPQRKSAVAGIALEAASSGSRVRVRIQGRAKCLVKSTTGIAIAVGDPLCFGTAKAMEADAPAVNTNRWIGYADEAVAAVTSATASLKDVILLGPHGLGMQASGT